MPPKQAKNMAADFAKVRNNASESLRKYKERLDEICDFEMPNLDFDTPELTSVCETSTVNEELLNATEFLESDGHRDILKDRVTVSASWKKLNITCITPKHYAFTRKEQLELLKGVELTVFDSCLLMAPPLPCVSIFSSALTSAVESNKSGKGPSLDQCLCWLTFAAQSSPGLLIPSGEFFPEVVDYISKVLTHPSLTEIEANDREELAVHHVAQVFEFLTNCNLSPIEPGEKAILLYAISRLILDRQLSEESSIQDKAVGLISHILVSSKNPKQVIWDFGQLIPGLCEDMRGLRTVLSLFRQADAPYPTCMCLLCFIFVHDSERGEWAQSCNFDLPDNEFLNDYAEAIKELLINVLEVHSEERSQQAALISMLDLAFHPQAVKFINKQTFTTIKDKLNMIKREWRRNAYTDDAILDTMMNNIFTRTSEDSKIIGFDTTIDDDMETASES